MKNGILVSWDVSTTLLTGDIHSTFTIDLIIPGTEWSSLTSPTVRLPRRMAYSLVMVFCGRVNGPA